MREVHFIQTLTATALVALAAQYASAAPTESFASQLFRKSVDAMHFKREEAVYTMRLQGSGSEGVRKMQVWFKSLGQDDAKLRIRLTEPADIRGTGFLTLIGPGGKSKDQWLYLPTYHKVRRIGRGNESEPFLDSDFTLEDVSVESKGKFVYTVSGSQKCGDAQCYVLTGTPESQAASYSKKIVFIRKDNFLNVRTEFYDADRKLQKILTLEKFHRDAASGRFVPDRFQMNGLAAHHVTSLEIDKRMAGNPADSLFTQNALEDGS